jgi:hypothetical protein
MPHRHLRKKAVVELFRDSGANPQPPNPLTLPLSSLMLSSLRFHLTLQSGNAKTGLIAVTTSSRATCSPTCAFFQNGCYADGGPLRFHWDKVSRGERGKPWREHLADLAVLPAGSKLRLNQAGDLPATDGKLSRLYARALVAAVKHLKAWTYSHHKLTPSNLQILRFLNRQGLTVNASTETESAADAAVAAGLPAVLTVDSAEARVQWNTAAGNRVIVCPAQQRDGVTCSDCMLCHSSGRGRRVIVAFLAHGTGRRRAQAAIAAATAGGAL